jgi:putative ABC transport system permease protein
MLSAKVSLLRRLSLRPLLRAPFRSALIVVGIALGVALQVSTRMASDSLVVTFETMVDQVSGRAHATIHGSGGALDGDLTAEALAVDGVEHAAGLVEVTLRDPQGGRPLLILGLDFLGDPHFLPFDVEGGGEDVVDDPLAFVNDPHAILVSQTFAARRGLKVGDALALTSAEGPTDFRVRGILEDRGPAAAFDGQVAVMFLDAAQVAFARGHGVDRIEVAFAPGADRAAALERLRGVVGARGSVELPEARRARVVRLLDPIRTVLALAGVLALLVAMFLIYNAVGIAVARRRYEIGVVRALGATRASVAGMFCVEALFLAVPGVALGLFAGRFFARVAVEQTTPTISQLYLPLRPPVPELDAATVAQALGVGLLAVVGAALVPALRAARVDPALAVRGRSRTEVGTRLPYRPMALAGVVVAGLAWGSTVARSMPLGMVAAVAVLGAAALVAPGLLVLLRTLLVRPSFTLPAPARLGLVHLVGHLAPSAVNAVALAVAVTLSVTVGVWRESMIHSVTGWFDEGLSGDLVISAGSPINDQYNVPFDDRALDRVRDVEGVAAVLPYRMATQGMGELELMVSAFDTETHARLLEARGDAWTVLDGPEPLEVGALSTGRRALLSESASRYLGLGAGDTVALSGPSGPVPFEVHAVIGGYFLDRPAVLIDRRHRVDALGDPSIDSIDVFLAEGAPPDAVAERLRARLGGGETLFVTRGADLRREVARTIEEGFRYAQSIEWVALLIALMGVLGTLLAAVLDRTRQLGIQRALGATRRQVALAVTVEAAALGVAAAVLGVLCGALQGAVVVHGIVGPGVDWDLDFVFPAATAARVGLLVVATAAIAGLIPARRAARIDVQRALSWE